MRTRLHTTRSLAFVSALAAAAGAMAQPCSNYTIRNAPASAILPGTTQLANSCDDCTSPITFPFPVTMYGSAYTTCNVSSDGVVQFLDDSSAYSNNCLPSSTFTGPAVMALWDDIDTDDVEGAGIYTRVDGVAPNRTFQIEWRVGYHWTSGMAHFAARFYEGQSRFDLIYDTVDHSESATIGVQAGAAGAATQFSCNAPVSLNGQMYTFDCTAPRITYQGKLTDSGAPVTGDYDMDFAFFRAPSGGTPLSVVTLDNVQVTKGLFTVALDAPGLTFDSEPLYLAISVAGQLLSGRQEVTYAPKAGYALNSGKAAFADRADVAWRAEGLSAPDGSPMDAAYVQNDGSVVVTGTLYANGLVLPPSVHTAVYSPAALDAVSNTTAHQHNGPGELVGTQGNTLVKFQMPVTLPPNSTITRIEFLAYDNTANDILLTVEHVNMQSPTSEVLATLSTEGVFPGYRLFSSGSLNLSGHDETCQTVLVVQWEVPSAIPTMLRMSSIRMTYRIGQQPE